MRPGRRKRNHLPPSALLPPPITKIVSASNLRDQSERQKDFLPTKTFFGDNDLLVGSGLSIYYYFFYLKKDERA